MTSDPDIIKAMTADELRAECLRLHSLINSPGLSDFLNAVEREAAHQVERWGEAHDRAKEPEDWFWLVGYLAGKCLNAHKLRDREKAFHHTVSTAAALYNWSRAIDRRSDLEKIVGE